MKFLEVIRFELFYQFRQRMTWIFMAAMYVLAFYLMQNFMTTAREGGTPINAPVSILNAVLITSLFGLVALAALFGDAGSRDAQTGTAPLLYSSSVRERQYVFGRFFGALLIGLIILSLIPLGAFTAVSLSDRGDAAMVPFRLSSYLTPYVIIVLPNLFITGVLLFTAALLSKRLVAGLTLSVALGFGSIMIWSIVGGVLGQWTLATYLDPLGFAATASLIRTWSTAERSTLGLPIGGALLWNRVLWIGGTALVLGLVPQWFRFSRQAGSSRRLRGKRAPIEKDAPRQSAIVVPVANRSFGLVARLRKALEIAAMSFRQIIGGRIWLLPVAALILLFVSGPELMEHVGVPLVPETPLLLAKVATLHYDSLVILLTILYAGELVWRDREARMNLIVDPLPVPDAAFLWGQLLGLGCAIALFQGLLMLTSIAIQLRVGHAGLDPLAYLKILFGYQLIDYLLFAALAIAIQVIVNQKYLGYLIAIMAYAFTVAAPLIGIEHKLLIFGSDPGWSYSAMTGFSPLGPVVLFKAYWFGWALLLMFAARLLWVRSVQPGLAVRLRGARRRFSSVSPVTVAVALALTGIAGGTIFYNTNVLNDYRGDNERKERRARYEIKYGQYEHVAQPRLESVRLEVELYPREQKALINGKYRLVNDTGQPIETLHLATASEVETRDVQLDRPSRPTLQDDDLGHSIYTLEPPLLPGDELDISFDITYDPRGFTNSGTQKAVLPGATYFEPTEWIPAIGYQENRRLRKAFDREAYQLSPRPEVTPLEERDARVRRTADRDMIDLEVIVGTAEDQIAIAPGALQREWRANGRRYFHYATDAPVRNLYAIFSAGYAVQRARWNDVEIEIVHDPGSDRNVERMVRSVKESLAYYTSQFGSYPYDQIRLVAAPGMSPGLRAYPMNIRYYEGISLMNPEKDPRDVDFLFGVVAHEVAHQWWGNQLTPADVEGGPLLSESLAWYSAFGVVEATFGKEYLDRFLYVMREAYLAPRPMADAPLLTASDWLDAYRRGPFAMFTLRTMIGEERVNLALRRMLQQYAGSEGALPTSLDLYRELRAVSPASIHPLLADLFEHNTYWNLSTRRATAEPLTDGSWRVAMDVTAEKLMVDEEGTETVLPMNELVEIGVYDASGSRLLYLRQHPITSGSHEVTIIVPFEPGTAGIDPRRLLIDPAWRNNTVKVQRNARGSPPDLDAGGVGRASRAM